MFDVTKSKLYNSIMEGAVKFFNLGDAATEAEVHQKLTEQAVPLDQLLEQTRTTAAADLATINERLTTLEGQVGTLTEQNSLKDATILELQTAQATAATAHSQQITALKTAHQSQVNALAGEVSSLRAGRPLEQEEAGDPHEAGKIKSTGTAVLEMKSDALADMLKKRNPNAPPPAKAAV